MTVKEKIKAIVEKYGYDAQSRQCIEEMAELTQAINKFWRKQLDCGKIEFPDDRIHSLPLARNTTTWSRRLPMCRLCCGRWSSFCIAILTLL